MKKEKQGEFSHTNVIKGEIMGNKEELSKPILIEDLGMMFPSDKSKRKHRYGLYKCGLCGNKFKASTYDINRGYIKSCGCKKLLSQSQSLSNTKLYEVWGAIKNRTLNPKHKHYNDYGGRGITICEEWKNDFMSFYNWAMSNGYSDELSIDRIDNDGNYCPENCRWTTRIIQSRNQRMQKNNKTGYKGVSFREDNNSFRVIISVNKKTIRLGEFKTAVEGAVAYNNYIIENNLEGFILNEIPQQILIEKEITNE